MTERNLLNFKELRARKFIMANKKTTHASEILKRRRRDDPIREDRVQRELAMLRLYQLFITMREQAGLTQEQMAERMGTTQSVISRIESEKYEKVTVSTLLKAASVTGFKLNIGIEKVA